MKLHRARLTPAQFARVVRLIHDRCGFELRVEQQPALERHLGERLHAAGIEEIDRYLTHIAAAGMGDAEFRALMDGVLVQETFFFRTPAHFTALKSRVVPQLLGRPLLRRAPRPLSAWSAGCATGPEPYSTAITLLESAAQDRFSLLATDISPHALEEARAGVYSGRVLRTVPPDQLARWFEPAGDGSRVREEVRARIRFSPHNLAADPFPAGVDVIFCRNVLIYFPADVRARIVRGFHAALTESGVIFLGHSETLSDHADLFERVWLDRAFAFVKRDPTAAAIAPAPRRTRRATAHPAPPPDSAPTPWRPIGIAAREEEAAPALEDIAVLRVEGTLDDAHAEESAASLKAQIAASLEQARTRVILDVTGVSFLDAAGIRLLRRAARLVADHGGRPCFVCGESPVRRWLEREGEHERLEMYGSVEQAREALTR